VNILDVLNEHIEQLKKFRDSIRDDKTEALRTLIEDANKIRRIIK
jgi:prephenate dehydrogenase